jgi:hypothetical protein
MAEVPEIGGREPTMLAGVRQIAYGLAMVMAGFLVIALANSAWAARFRTDALVLLGIEKPTGVVFDGEPWWWVIPYGYNEAFGLGVVMWLIGYAIRRVARSTSSGRPA